MFTKCLRSIYSPVPRRFFCQHQNQEESSHDLKTRILKTALIHVNRSGWSNQALAEACIDLGYPAVTSRVVPGGPIDLVYYALDNWNERLVEDMQYLELEQMRISDRITQGIKIRLSYQIPYLSRWNEAIALGGLPQNAPYTLHKLGKIADDIWYIAGDRSSDLNWYTKRGLLLAAYATTEMHMLTDKSQNYVETWRFLERRISDILRYGQGINTVRTYSSAIHIGVSSLVSVLAPYPNRFENDIDDLRYQQSQQRRDSTSTTAQKDAKDNTANKPEEKNADNTQDKIKERVHEQLQSEVDVQAAVKSMKQ